MADNSTTTPETIDDDIVDEGTPGYKPPAQKSLAEIEQLDADDESLVKYKQQLLAGIGDVKDEGGENVLVKQLALIVEGREDVKIDLTGDITKLKEKPIVIKEGVKYRVEISFRVQREIVAGLKYVQNSYRKGIRVGSESFMVGSYGPKTEDQVYRTPIDEAPSGMIARGNYSVKSRFTDDDKKIYLQWEWAFHITKDWK